MNNEQEKKSAVSKPFRTEKIEHFFFRASAADFKKIPGSPIAYWVSKELRNAFCATEVLGDVAYPCQGMATTNNALFLRRWFEVSGSKTKFDAESEDDAEDSKMKWFPYNKGGEFRKWYGNNEYLVNFEHRGKTICDYIDNTLGAKVSSNGRVINRDKYFQPSITWSFVSSSFFGVRVSNGGALFDVGGSSLFPPKQRRDFFAGFLCSKVAFRFMGTLNPTINFQVGNVAQLPLPSPTAISEAAVKAGVSTLINASKSDWDNFETSWDFRDQPLLRPRLKGSTLAASWRNWEAQSIAAIRRMQELETENNRLFITAYGLDGELQPEVPEDQITLASADKLKDMAAFISYAVGCMFGRYSLDKPGLILANQGETIEDYLKQIQEPAFMPDDDGILPVIEGEWFTDDITNRFKEFVKVTFGEVNYPENINFIENAIGKDLRKYFLKDFYPDHAKRYKKRPIYWMFSSPKGYFNALIYMHRYQPDTVSVILNDYLKEFQVKLNSHKKHLEEIVKSESMPDKEKIKAQKEIEAVIIILKDLDDYEKKILHSLATEKIAIDLDDGVKVNYLKFGCALRQIPGLEAKDE